MNKAVLCFFGGSVFVLLLLSSLSLKGDGKTIYMYYYCLVASGLGVAWLYSRFKKPWILFLAPFVVLAFPIPDKHMLRQQRHLMRLREEISALSTNIPPETYQEINRKIYLEMRGETETNAQSRVTNTVPTASP